MLSINENCIHGYKYDGKDYFVVLEDTGRPNPYKDDIIASGTATITNNPEDLFDSIVAKPTDTPTATGDTDNEKS